MLAAPFALVGLGGSFNRTSGQLVMVYSHCLALVRKSGVLKHHFFLEVSGDCNLALEGPPLLLALEGLSEGQLECNRTRMQPELPTLACSPV